MKNRLDIFWKCDNINTLNRIITELPTRTAADPGYIICHGNTANLDTATLSSKKWNVANDNNLVTVARYKFDRSIHEDVVPIFNDGFTYFTKDTISGDHVTRTIEIIIFTKYFLTIRLLHVIMISR